jgi:16S rRNA (adenine1518-N6/adenine1519-N6)-dimethyltransferase
VFLEIGAGGGQLTLPLARSVKARLLAIEPEPYLAGRLRKAIGVEKLQQVEVIEADFLSLDLTDLLNERDLTRVRVVGNLPYSIASHMLQKLLAVRNRLTDLTLMFQQEVAERLIASPSTKAYGYLSVMAQQATQPRIVFRIPPHAFKPRPKVNSALVRLEPKDAAELPVADIAVFKALVKSLLAHRRKNISNNLKHLRSKWLEESTVRHGLAHLNIDDSRRAESLTVEEFAALSQFCASPR